MWFTSGGYGSKAPAGEPCTALSCYDCCQCWQFVPPCCWTCCFTLSSTVPISSCWYDTLVTNPSFPWCQVLLRGHMSCLTLLSHHSARRLWRHLLNLVRIAARVTGRCEPAFVPPPYSLLAISLVNAGVSTCGAPPPYCHCLRVDTSHRPCIGCAQLSSTGAAAPLRCCTASGRCRSCRTLHVWWRSWLACGCTC